MSNTSAEQRLIERARQEHPGKWVCFRVAKIAWVAGTKAEMEDLREKYRADPANKGYPPYIIHPQSESDVACAGPS